MADQVLFEFNEKELDGIIADFKKQSYDLRQEGIMAGAEYLKDKLEAASPIGPTGEYAKSWAIEDGYMNRVYVYNMKVVPSKTKQFIPLSNILEYSLSSKHYGSIRALFDSNKSGIYNAILEKIKNGGK